MKSAFILYFLLFVHDFYSYACCSARDCHPVPCEEIKEYGRGWHWGTVYFTFPMMQPAPDGRCHVCVSRDAEHRLLEPHCIYLPPRTT